MKWPYLFSATQSIRDFYTQLKGLFSDVGSDMQEQKSRVDNLITNAPQPSEVVDIRTDENGVVHPTARDRIIADKADLQANIDQNKTDQGVVNDSVAAQLATKQSFKITDDSGYATTTTDLNSIVGTKTIALNASVANRPFDYGTVFQISNSDQTKTQTAIDNYSGAIAVRSYNQGDGWSSWVNYATQLADKLNISDIIDTGLQPLTLVNGTQGNAQYRTVTFNGIFKIIIIWASIYNLPNNTACITLPADTQNGQNNSWLDPWLIVPSSLDTNDSHSAGIKIMPGNQVFSTLHGSATPSDDYNFTYMYLV